jgi:hypothetical protein
MKMRGYNQEKQAGFTWLGFVGACVCGAILAYMIALAI